MDASKTHAVSFEQDLLWSVLDQDAIPHILVMAKDNWHLDAVTAFRELQSQAEKGRLRAYRDAEPYTLVNLSELSLDEVAEDFRFFVEPTSETQVRLQRIEERLRAP